MHIKYTKYYYNKCIYLLGILIKISPGKLIQNTLVII